MLTIIFFAVYLQVSAQIDFSESTHNFDAPIAVRTIVIQTNFQHEFTSYQNILSGHLSTALKNFGSEIVEKKMVDGRSIDPTGYLTTVGKIALSSNPSVGFLHIKINDKTKINRGKIKRLALSIEYTATNNANNQHATWACSIAIENHGNKLREQDIIQIAEAINERISTDGLIAQYSEPPSNSGSDYSTNTFHQKVTRPTLPKVFYIKHNNQKEGPFNEVQIKKMISAGRISQQTSGWKEGTSHEWVAIDQLLSKDAAPTPRATTTDTDKKTTESGPKVYYMQGKRKMGPYALKSIYRMLGMGMLKYEDYIFIDGVTPEPVQLGAYIEELRKAAGETQTKEDLAKQKRLMPKIPAASTVAPKS